VHLTIHEDLKDVQFYEINSGVNGQGGKIVHVVINALPDDWTAVVVMDWSQGFWEKMQTKYNKLEII